MGTVLENRARGSSGSLLFPGSPTENSQLGALRFQTLIVHSRVRVHRGVSIRLGRPQVHVRLKRRYAESVRSIETGRLAFAASSIEATKGPVSRGARRCRSRRWK